MGAEIVAPQPARKDSIPGRSAEATGTTTSESVASFSPNNFGDKNFSLRRNLPLLVRQPTQHSDTRPWADHREHLDPAFAQHGAS